MKTVKSSASSRPAGRTARKGHATKRQTSKYELDLVRPAPLTPAQKADVKTLKARPDSDIDYSDIPPLADSFWKNAVRNPFYRPAKSLTTVRIDADVLHWLRDAGKGYQTRINAILRDAMLTALKATSSKER